MGHGQTQTLVYALPSDQRHRSPGSRQAHLPPPENSAAASSDMPAAQSPNVSKPTESRYSVCPSAILAVPTVSRRAAHFDALLSCCCPNEISQLQALPRNSSASRSTTTLAPPPPPLLLAYHSTPQVLRRPLHTPPPPPPPLSAPVNPVTTSLYLHHVRHASKSFLPHPGRRLQERPAVAVVRLSRLPNCRRRPAASRAFRSVVVAAVVFAGLMRGRVCRDQH